MKEGIMAHILNFAEIDNKELGITGYAEKYAVGLKMAVSFFSICLCTRKGGTAGDKTVDQFHSIGA